MTSHATEPADSAGPVYYSPAQVAARLGVSRYTAYELVASGQLPAIRISRRPDSDKRKAAIRIHADDLAAYEQRLRDEAETAAAAAAASR
jgi:excisionase family DNA binding protein